MTSYNNETKAFKTTCRKNNLSSPFANSSSSTNESREILVTLSIVAELQIKTEKYKTERVALMGNAETAQ